MRHSSEVLNDKLTEIMGAKVNTELGGPTRITQHIKTLICFVIWLTGIRSESWMTNSTLHKVQPMEWSCRY